MRRQMTGRDLIVYILENGLENEPVFKDGKIIGFKTETEVAKELGVGIATVHTWCMLDMIQHVLIGDKFLIPGNHKSPMK